MTYIRDPEFNPSDEQRANLAKLAGYLAALPDDYAHFNMSEYYGIFDEDVGEVYPSYGPLEGDKPELSDCGSCACAIGHGPAAGIPVDPLDYDWPPYALRVFGASNYATKAGAYMFGVQNADDPHAAAGRIREVLAAHEGAPA